MIGAWNHFTDAFMRENIDKMTMQEMADHFDKTTNSISQRLRKLGLLESKDVAKKPKANRIKPKQAREPNKLEQEYHDHVRSLGCLVCGLPAVIHHIMHMKGKEMRRDHRYVAPLCNTVHHNFGKCSVHMLGGEAQFKEKWHIDLVQWAVDNWIKFIGEHNVQ